MTERQVLSTLWWKKKNEAGRQPSGATAPGVTSSLAHTLGGYRPSKDSVDPPQPAPPVMAGPASPLPPSEPIVSQSADYATDLSHGHRQPMPSSPTPPAYMPPTLTRPTPTPPPPTPASPPHTPSAHTQPPHASPPASANITAPAAGRPKRRVVGFFAKTVVCACILGLIWLGCTLFYYTLRFPDPTAVGIDQRTPVLRILARDGSLLGERGGAHTFMPLGMLPRHAVDAVVAIEDRRFFKHWGLDPVGLLRATFVNMRAGRFVQGGSTLTQQLAKNMFLTPERTLTRKLQEMVLAIWLEARLSKDVILELYLNRVYFGGGAYGIESASQRYFAKPASSLTVAEAAVLAGLVKAPSRLAPSANPGLARRRGRRVLTKMHEAGFLSLDQLADARQEAVRFRHMRPRRTAATAGYAVNYVLEQMPELIDPGHGDIIVETTIDPDLQKHASKTLRTMLEKSEGTTPRRRKKSAEPDAKQGAVLVLDNQGGIRAMVGGREFAKSQFNRAVKARRQPGSTFKPFVFLTALETGATPSSVAYDLPITVGDWSPKNSTGSYSGAVTLREALSKSINTVAVRLALDAGPATVMATAQRLGLAANDNTDPSIALGTAEVTLLDLVRSYNTIANSGVPVQAHVISRIRSSRGRVLFAKPGYRGHRVAKREDTAALTAMLQDAINNGTGKRAKLRDHPAAGKTGTSQDFRDAWFVGYTGHLTAGVWIGDDQGRPMKQITGGGLPAQVWQSVMQRAHRDLQPRSLAGLDGVPRRRGTRNYSTVPRALTVESPRTVPLRSINQTANETGNQSGNQKRLLSSKTVTPASSGYVPRLVAIPPPPPWRPAQPAASALARRLTNFTQQPTTTPNLQIESILGQMQQAAPRAASDQFARRSKPDAWQNVPTNGRNTPAMRTTQRKQIARPAVGQPSRRNAQTLAPYQR
ncbi:MAG: PBP1A family penicillin-binding protein, partial [Pseudomonadota bacterium]